MSFGKWLVSRPLTLTLSGLALRIYRRFVFGTMLMEHDPALQRLLRSRDPVIFATWHQDFVFTLGYLSRWNPRRRTYALASPSRDGSLISAIAESLGYRKPIRGSTSHGGSRALLELTRLLRRDRAASLAVVCDGPRPPARELKPGILHLAQKTGRPIWLLRTSFQSMHVLEKTWAKFHVPFPQSRGVCLADGPILVPRDLDRDQLERLRVDVEARLNRLADRADRVASGLGRAAVPLPGDAS